MKADRRKLLSKRRAGRAARRIVRREMLAFLKKNWILFSAIACMGVLATVGVAAVQRTDLARGVAIGVFGTLTVSGVAYGLAVGGFTARSVGAEAERWTTIQLRKLPATSWSVVDDVRFDDGNVDHVVVGPGQIYAVETKWTLNSGPAGQWLRSAASQVEHRAGKIRRLLRSHGLEREVVPVLVVWGGGDEPFAGRQTRWGSTRVVAGGDASEWRDRMIASATGEFDRDAYDAIVSYMQRYVGR